MPGEAIRYEEVEGAATITLDRPESRNAFSARVGDELQALRQVPGEG